MVRQNLGDALVLRVDNVPLMISELAEKVMVRCVGGGQSRAARVEGARRAPFETMPAGIDAARPEPEAEQNVALAGSEMWFWDGAKCGFGRERNVSVAGGNDPFNPFQHFDKMMNA